MSECTVEFGNHGKLLVEGKGDIQVKIGSVCTPSRGSSEESRENFMG